MPEQNENTQRNNPHITQYMKSNRKSNWIVLIFVLSLIAMVIIWAFLGTMKTTVSVTGIQHDGHFVGYVSPKDAISLENGMDVDYNGEHVGVLTDRDITALSITEVKEIVDNSYYISKLELNEYNITVNIDVDKSCPDGIVTLDVVIAEMRPFDFFMN